MPENLLSYDGRKYTATIDGTNVAGEIAVYSGVVYLLQNGKDGNTPGSTDRMRGYSCSWNVSRGDTDSLKRNEVENLVLLEGELQYEFKIGQNVRVKTSITHFRYGCTASTRRGKIEAFSIDPMDVLVRFDDRSLLRMLKSELEPDPSAPVVGKDLSEVRVCRFSEGDRVRIRVSTPYKYGGAPVCYPGTVIKVNSWSDIKKCTELIVKFDSGETYSMGDDELTTCSDEPKTEYSYTFRDGQTFSATIQGTYCEGKVTIEDFALYLCQDKKNGSNCADKKGYKYSWKCEDGSDRALARENIGVKNLKLDISLSKDAKPEIASPPCKFKVGDIIKAKVSAPNRLTYGGSKGDFSRARVIEVKRNSSDSCWDLAVNTDRYTGYWVVESEFELFTEISSDVSAAKFIAGSWVRAKGEPGKSLLYGRYPEDFKKTQITRSKWNESRRCWDYLTEDSKYGLFWIAEQDLEWYSETTTKLTTTELWAGELRYVDPPKKLDVDDLPFPTEPSKSIDLSFKNVKKMTL